MILKVLLQTARPSFLVLTPVCVFLGLSTSLAGDSPIDLMVFFILLIGAISAHISVNMLNEYIDFKSGLDVITEKTPFSGGSGALPESPENAAWVLLTSLFFLMVTAGIGIFFIMEMGFKILPIGGLGLALIITYTTWLNRIPFLCLLAPGFGFGVLMVVGTHIVLTGEHSLLSWMLSLIPFFLINNLLLLNQYPDINADESVGRQTFPIVYGLNKSNAIYALFMLLAYLHIIFYIWLGYIPKISMIAVLPVVLSIFSLSGAIKFSSKIGDHPKFLAANVATSILTPLLLGIAVLFS